METDPQKLPGFVNLDDGYDLDQALASVGKGWSGLIREMFKKKPKKVKIEQVKEKFGSLRVYANDVNFEETVIDNLSKRSETICEWCGKPGSLDNRYWWLITLCDSCKIERKALMDEKGIKERATS